MEEFGNTSTPIFKRLDREIFTKIDQFRLSPGHNNLQDFYNGLEEEQQKFFKASVLLAIFLLPALFLGLVWWQNLSLREDLESRRALISQANEVIGLKQSLVSVLPAVLSDSPIDGASMMTSRISNLLSSVGVDLSKIQVSNYEGVLTSSTIMRAEADFKFTGLSTDELMNIFTAMIQREKFRIESISINRNSETNLLDGQFHAIHFGNATVTEEE